MTDLEKRVENYIDDKALVVLSSRKDVVDLIVNFAKAETALLSQHILDLQKDKGNLTDRVRELEQQIEKMKCCYNCKHSRTEYEHCKTDKSEKWEIKEK